MKKLNFRVILFQIIGIISLIHGILQLRFFTVAEKFICATYFQNKKLECWNRLFPKKKDVISFWPSIYIWIFLGFLLGIFMASFLNWRNRLSSLNTILVAIVMYIIMRFKFFRKGILSRLFHSFVSLFSDDPAIQFLVGGIIFTLIGVAILWLSVTPNLFNSKKDII
jgi:hypothetical protein